jgi:hypothetical protein
MKNLPKLTYRKHYAHLISRNENNVWECSHPLCRKRFTDASLFILAEFFPTVIPSPSETLAVIIEK